MKEVELKMTAKTNQTPKHYWMAAVVISFVADGRAMDTTINALINSTEYKVTTAMLGRLQVQAQTQLAKSLGDQMPDVKFVHINSVSYLGQMTDEEFLGDYKPNVEI